MFQPTISLAFANVPQYSNDPTDENVVELNDEDKIDANDNDCPMSKLFHLPMIENAANNVSEHATHKAKIIRNKQFISNQNKIDNEHAIGLFCMQQWDSNMHSVDVKKNNIVHQEET